MKIIAFSVMGLLIFIIGCAPTSVAPAKTQLQKREFQTRSYETSDTTMVLKAVLNVLQDEGYIVKNAVVELGLLTATKEVDAGTSGGEKFWKFMFWGASARWKQNVVIEASATVSDFGDVTRVRLIFQAKAYDNAGMVVDVRQIDDEQFYKDFFIKIDKGIFLQQENI